MTTLLLMPASAQKDLKDILENYFKNYRPVGQRIRSNAHLKSYEQNDSLRTIVITADNHFGEQTFTPNAVEGIYKDIQTLIPDSCQDYQLTIKSGGTALSWEDYNEYPSDPQSPTAIQGGANSANSGGTFTAGSSSSGATVMLPCRARESNGTTTFFWREFKIAKDGRIYSIAAEGSGGTSVYSAV